ncbi:hypothetical protein DFS34DRAFT_597077 [Phlyctochytrium arcticum]|nr:hypothetical protein DFS34DRAFT_597077 [Phlyctochytrium arcticum]
MTNERSKTKFWYYLADASGDIFPGTRMTGSRLVDEATVTDLRQAVKKRCLNSTSGIPAMDLIIYANKADVAASIPLPSNQLVGSLHDTEKDPLLVVVPEVLRARF